MSLAEKIDVLLPQTQCRRCGYPACKTYAEAIANSAADINQCPPGGVAGIHRLAALLGREYLPLSPEHGAEMSKQVVRIDENLCVGCTLCIQACPVDAIVGASKLMHTVIVEQCTGCELCLPPCPVDCIHLVQFAQPDEDSREGDSCDMSVEEKTAADAARTRYKFHQFRLKREQHEHAEQLAARSNTARAIPDSATAEKQALIAAAIARTRAKQVPNE